MACHPDYTRRGGGDSSNLSDVFKRHGDDALSKVSAMGRTRDQQPGQSNQATRTTQSIEMEALRHAKEQMADLRRQEQNPTGRGAVEEQIRQLNQRIADLQGRIAEGGGVQQAPSSTTPTLPQPSQPQGTEEPWMAAMNLLQGVSGGPAKAYQTGIHAQQLLGPDPTPVVQGDPALQVMNEYARTKQSLDRSGASRAAGMVVGAENVVVAGGTATAVVLGLTAAAPVLATAAVAGLFGYAVGSAVEERRSQGQSVGTSLAGGLLDATGISKLYAGITNRDLVTQKELHLSEFERGRRQVEGGAETAATVAAGAGLVAKTARGAVTDEVGEGALSADRQAAATSKGSKQSTWRAGRYADSASDPGAYQASGGKVFPTARNSGLTGQGLAQEQLKFFKNGLAEGKSPSELRGQAANAGYTRHGGNADPNDRLAMPGAEARLQQAIRESEQK